MNAALKERPILFSGAMVRAILEGRKSQTRRILKGSTEFKGPYNPEYLEQHRHADGWAEICPYGRVGDRLWVKETFKPHCEGEISEEFPLGTCIKYRADGAMLKPENWTSEEGQWCEAREESTRWYPSIFMRRHFSRITLEITGVRVERLHEISDADCYAEGITDEDIGIGLSNAAYLGLWEKFNGRASVEANPWMWVIEFNRVAA